MSFRLVPKSVTLNDFELRNRVTLRYFTEFGKPAFQHNRADLWQNLCKSLLYFVVRLRRRRNESSRSLSHLLISFLYNLSHAICYTYGADINYCTNIAKDCQQLRP